MTSNTIPNDVEPSNPLVVVNLTNMLKLNNTNYLSWKLQLAATLVGYGLFKFIDGSYPSPPSSITKDATTSPNPAYASWVR